MSDPDTTHAGKLLVMRVDASATIGTGHVMRLIALGQAWLEGDGHVRILCREMPSSLLVRLHTEGFDVHGAKDDGDPGSLLKAILAADRDARAAIDSPLVNVAELTMLADEANRVLVMDDMALLPRCRPLCECR